MSRAGLLKDIQKVREVKAPPKLEPKSAPNTATSSKSTSNSSVSNVKKTGPPRPEDHGYAFDSMYITDDIIMEIFSYLDGYYISRCSATCKRWKGVTQNNELWRKLTLSNFEVSKVKYIVLDQMDQKGQQSWKQIYQSFWTERNSQNVAIVTEDYDAQNPGELSIRKGERIFVLERRKTYNKSSYADLWEGLYKGHIGLFPHRCIGVEDQQFEIVAPAGASMIASMWSRAQQLKQRAKPPVYTGSNRIVTALYSYTMQISDELTFQEGDKIEVLQEYGNWPLGKNLRTLEIGLFPCNYVQ